MAEEGWGMDHLLGQFLSTKNPPERSCGCAKTAAWGDTPLPIIETQLQQLLGNRYVDKHWHAALTTVMDAEGKAVQVSVAIEKLAAAATHHTGIVTIYPWLACAMSTITFLFMRCRLWTCIMLLFHLYL